MHTNTRVAKDQTHASIAVHYFGQGQWNPELVPCLHKGSLHPSHLQQLNAVVRISNVSTSVFELALCVCVSVRVHSVWPCTSHWHAAKKARHNLLQPEFCNWRLSLRARVVSGWNFPLFQLTHKSLGRVGQICMESEGPEEISRVKETAAKEALLVKLSKLCQLNCIFYPSPAPLSRKWSTM